MNRKQRHSLFITSIFWLCLLFTLSASALSPSSGHVEKSAYMNDFFNLSYAWPNSLRPIDTATLNVRPPAQSENEILLFSAKKEREGSGIIIFAEKPDSKYQPANGRSVGQDFLDHVKKWLDPAGHPKITRETQMTNSSGILFYELDYIHFGEYTSAIVTEVGEYQIVFRCNAKSSADLAEITKSVLSSRHIK